MGPVGYQRSRHYRLPGLIREEDRILLCEYPAGRDPTLELEDASGTILASNDIWKTRPDGSIQQAEIEATTIPPPDESESALVASLSPGNYTAIIRGRITPPVLAWWKYITCSDESSAK
jgi:hypothetical protein